MDTGDMTEGFLALQSCLAVAMLVVTCAAGCAPLLLLTMMKKKGKDQSKSGWLSYLSCFSGGVFMATCFLDIIPHIGQNYQEILDNYGLEFPVPMSQVFICCGFFLVYFIEEITAKVFGSSGHGHSHGPPKPLSVEPMKRENITRQQLLEEGSNSANQLTVDSRMLNRHSLVVEEASPWVVSDEKSNLLKSLTFAVAMSFHSLLEGFALGVQETTTAIYALFFSLLLHKSIEAFSVGLQISKTNSEKNLLATAETLVRHNHVSILWQIPQFVLMTIGEILFSITGLEFCYSEASPHLKSVVQALWLFTTAIGDLIDVGILWLNLFTDSAVQMFVFGGCMVVVILVFSLLAMYYYQYAEYSHEVDTEKIVSDEEKTHI